jgi:soluble lytic murein transglycosylase-like protein
MSLNIKIPMIERAFYKPSDTDAILGQVDYIYDRFGKYIKRAASLNNLPSDLIASVAFIESRGDEKIISRAGAVGVMQLDNDSATNVVFREAKAKRLSPEERELLNRLLGKQKVDCMTSMKYHNHKLPCNRNTGSVISKKDLLNPELNIMIGTMLLGQLIDQHTEGSVVRLDKVIVRYNRGYFSKPQGSTVSETLAYAKKTGGAETESFILKLVGTNGLLHLLS